ncbi:hypothetical protein [Kitasatospora purpeofusca]|uniref:hypothetical protein n=1 Tax=Kitasatospora purpeofusca TaxID=67352 RepID=UPI0036D39630
MDPLGASAVITASAVAARVTTVVCQYLRLRWRVHQEHAHRRTLEALARTLPRGSRLHEVHSDGSTWTLTVARSAREPQE